MYIITQVNILYLTNHVIFVRAFAVGLEVPLYFSLSLVVVKNVYWIIIAQRPVLSKLTYSVTGLLPKLCSQSKNNNFSNIFIKILRGS